MNTGKAKGGLRERAMTGKWLVVENNEKCDDRVRTRASVNSVGTKIQNSHDVNDRPNKGNLRFPLKPSLLRKIHV